MNYYFFEDSLSIREKLKDDNVNNALVFLKSDWDDSGYKTQFMSIIFSEKNTISNNMGLNIVSIGSYSDTKTFDFLKKRKLVNKRISKFPDSLFMLGNLDYYTNLKRTFNDYDLDRIYKETRDISFDENIEILENVKSTEIYKTSFLREKTQSDVKKIINYVNNGSKYNYNSLAIEIIDENDDIEQLNLSSKHDGYFSSNIFAIIGNNGSGKTSLLKDIAISVDRFGEYTNSNLKKIKKIKVYSDEPDSISHIVFITYSPFDLFNDEFIRLFLNSDNNINRKYTLVSNRKTRSNGYFKDTNYNEIASPTKFSNSLESSLERAFYNNNDLFEEVLGYLDFSKDIIEFIEKIKTSSFTMDSEGIRNKMFSYTKKLSSGQKIILSMLANLVDNSNSNSLFLIDEPESYLHPPFLLSLILAIDHITKMTDSICIIVTHSSIAVQELESNNVFIINDDNSINNPSIQTFATSSQEINDYVFGVDIRSTGYYKKIKNFVKENSDGKIDATMFNGKLSNNAIVLISAFRE